MGYELDGLGSIPGRDKGSLLHSVQRGSEAYQPHIELISKAL
jgi:hypothetical protein